jgi:hypothetical protein
MKKATMILIIGLVLSLSTVTVFAAGDKNHGEVGKGEVEQHQVCVDDNGSPSF